MKTQVHTFTEGPVTFYIGENAGDNDAMFDICHADDIWFHAKHVSSCHVVAVVNGITIKKSSIVKRGAMLCKAHTHKLSKLSAVEIIYTKIKHISKTNTPGCVITSSTKEISV